MAATLQRYRIIAWVVGVGLLVLVFAAMPLKYFANSPSLVAIVGPIHGFLYVVYLLASVDLALRNRWNLTRTVLVMLAGTVPFLSFVAERKITAEVTASMATASPAAASGR